MERKLEKMNNLKSLRVHYDIQIDEILKALKISRTTYYNYENEITYPPYNILFALADFYNVSIDYLLGHELKDEEKSNDFSLVTFMKKNNVDEILNLQEKESIRTLVKSLLEKSKTEK